MSVRFCLSYDLLNAILYPSKFVYFKCGHNIIYDMVLSTE